jgi:hypothetical protein
VNNIDKIISQLERQKTAINRAIDALREVSDKGAAATVKSVGSKPVARKKRRLSPEGRRRIAEAARRRWAALRAGQSGKETAKPAKRGRPAKKTAKARAARKAAAATPTAE